LVQNFKETPDPIVCHCCHCLSANQLIKERTRQEDVAFRKTPMVAASFIRKASGACYLSASIKGESRHRYVRKADEEYWKKRARQWREFSKAMTKWVRLNWENKLSILLTVY
jgi:hypothetical protein